MKSRVTSQAAVGVIAMLGLGSIGPAAQPALPLTQGMVIERSVTIRPGTYALTGSADLKTPAITIRGENITVDFNGARLVGSPDSAAPDQFAGVAILVDGGSKVTIRNATVRGFKVGILARNSPDLHITRNDLSHNWKQRLYSGIEKESLVDWMSYHHNDNDEAWLRFGGAIYLIRCDRAELDHNTILQGQNGVMATASKGLKIWNNTIQFMSSIGVGLYRVTESTIMHNRIDWCVRGYSHGFYNRGQDSAGLLMYEQSSRNMVAYNSITHGGDGLFLWAGQSTMDTGEGGSHDNVFYQNNFSHAPTNGIEATFSRNGFYENRIDDCWHGVWGGYSYRSEWIGNEFRNNAEAVAIEHGQENTIAGNTFSGDETAIRLWQNATQDPSWGYAKYRDTRSRTYHIANNTFQNHKTAIDLRDTAGVTLTNNRFSSVGTAVSRSGNTPDLVDNNASREGNRIGDALQGANPMPGGFNVTPPIRRGRQTIIVDEWGPYDWKSPKLWPVLPSDGKLPFQRRSRATGQFDGPVKLNVLGPEGSWKLLSARGATIAPAQGRVGDVISVTPGAGAVTDYEIVLSYVGSQVTSPRGVVTPAGRPYTFTFSRFFAPADWTINYFVYPEALEPVTSPEGFAKIIAGKPAKTVKNERIDFLSGGVLEEGVPRDRFAFVAEGTVTLPRGDYTLQLISDDGARVWVDGKLLVDAWAPHESRVDEAVMAGGTRRLKVEYYEVSGWAEIRLDIQPRRTRN